MIATIIILSILLFVFIYRSEKIQTKYSDLEIQNEMINTELDKYRPIIDIEKEARELKLNLERDQKYLDELVKNISEYEFTKDIHELGYYRPKFFFEDVLQYSEALELIKEAQKELIKNKNVIDILGSRRGQDNKHFINIGKIATGSFNGETYSIIESVTYANFEKSKEKIIKCFGKINNLLKDFKVSISKQYLDLKLKEMAVGYDYREAEKKAKDEQIELKDQMREEEKARVEAEKFRAKAIKEQEEYSKAIEEAKKDMESKSDDEKASLKKQIQKLQSKLEEATAERERATSMAQITKEGHVYIISNIGSFGENVYKIGMTRRKDPMDRVKELGDASVPFPFDVHALVRVKNAPEVENSLHKYFESKRMNKINGRKEFFKTSIDEIAAACSFAGHKLELTKLAEAREYRQTLEIENG